jgi:hypothetical protein
VVCVGGLVASFCGALFLSFVRCSGFVPSLVLNIKEAFSLI